MRCGEQLAEMNLSLLDPFQDDLPEVIEEYLDHGVTKCIAFNRRGTLLAAGCSDGSCVIWDFGTRGVVKELKSPGFSAPVTTVSWSKDGRQILSAYANCSLSLWDVAKGTKISTVHLPTVVLIARLSPRSLSTCLVCPVASPPLLVDVSTNEKFSLPLTSARVNETGSLGRCKNSVDSANVSSPAAAAFSKLGDLVYVGTARGEILVVSVETREVVSSLQGPGGALVKQLQISRNGQFLFTNSNDRVLRVYENLVDTNKLHKRQSEAKSIGSAGVVWGNNAVVLESNVVQEPMLKFLKEYQDAVNRCQWKSACFSGNGEYVAGAPLIRGEHKIHIFSRGFGQLARILEGPKEAVVDLAWHPTRPTVASVSQSGLIYLWAKDYMENWSAFAPDFKELEDNEEYVEQEDEFDIVPDEDKVKPSKLADENVEVDIETVEKITAFSDSDDSEQNLYFLPTAPEPDGRPDLMDTEEGPEVDGPLVVEGQSQNCEGTPRLAHLEGKRTASITEESGPEEETRQNVRQARKRKLSEKAAELEAERVESAKKAGRNNTPGGKKNGQSSS